MKNENYATTARAGDPGLTRNFQQIRVHPRPESLVNVGTLLVAHS